jgi:hypothetical protein
MQERLLKIWARPVVALRDDRRDYVAVQKSLRPPQSRQAGGNE